MFRCVAEARDQARKRLPAAVFHYVDGGKEAESTVFENEAAFAWQCFLRAACPVATRPGPSVDLLGQCCAMPLVIAPTGFVRIIHPDGELGAARAAARAGIPIVLSIWSSAPAGHVLEANPDTWFQRCMINGR